MSKPDKRDKRKILHQLIHLVRPPRLEGVVKNAKMNPVRKKKKEKLFKGEPTVKKEEVVRREIDFGDEK